MREELKVKILERLATGPKIARELVSLVGASQPTLSRAIRELGTQVVILGRGRATRYARPRLVRGITSQFPVYRIDEAGDAHLLGLLQVLAGGHYWWQPEDSAKESRLSDYLPWFIQDMRPEGFVGRAFAQGQGADLGLPAKLTDWTDDDVLIALFRRGEDHIGNLIIGEESIERYLKFPQKPSPEVPEPARQQVYADLARAAMEGDPAGSSAGGEQPKFAAMLRAGDVRRHVLVKFSPPIIQADGQRWADLLLCEHLALEVVRDAGIPSASSRILEADSRVFLEVDRFDRVGSSGRSSLLSLRAIDGEYLGIGSDWAKCARGLLQAGVISPEDARKMRWLKVFGDLIGNTDMHLGNLSFIRVRSRFYALAPVYDMLPMLYRPVSGETPHREFAPGAMTLETADVRPEALQSALRFWDRAGAEPRLSDEFKAICRNNFSVLQKLETAPRIITKKV